MTTATAAPSLDYPRRLPGPCLLPVDSHHRIQKKRNLLNLIVGARDSVLDES